MLVGYARVSTNEQNLDLQLDALGRAGCERTFTDVTSGATSERPGLSELLDYIRAGDTFVVWKLDRLGRSLPHLIQTVEGLRKKDIGFRSLEESLDTTSPAGNLVFHVFASLAQFELEVIRARTHAGLAAAKARGRLGGRVRILSDAKIAQALAMYRDGSTPVGSICETLHISRSTFYRYLAAANPTSQAIEECEAIPKPGAEGDPARI